MFCFQRTVRSNINILEISLTRQDVLSERAPIQAVTPFKGVSGHRMWGTTA
jgi:hypothetical protein